MSLSNFANKYTYFKPVLAKASPSINATAWGITIEPFMEVQFLKAFSLISFIFGVITMFAKFTQSSKAPYPM